MTERRSINDRLISRLRYDLGEYNVPQDSVLRRTYAGSVQRAQGAWSWALDTSEPRAYTVGSQFPVNLLVRCRGLDYSQPRVSVDDIHVDPCPRCYARFIGQSRDRMRSHPRRE